MQASRTLIGDLIDRLGGYREVAAALKCRSPQVVTNWISRDFIPRGRWPALVRLARERSVDGVSYDVLHTIHGDD